VSSEESETRLSSALVLDRAPPRCNVSFLEDETSLEREMIEISSSFSEACRLPSSPSAAASGGLSGASKRVFRADLSENRSFVASCSTQDRPVRKPEPTPDSHHGNHEKILATLSTPVQKRPDEDDRSSNTATKVSQGDEKEGELDPPNSTPVDGGKDPGPPTGPQDASTSITSTFPVAATATELSGSFLDDDLSQCKETILMMEDDDVSEGNAGYYIEEDLFDC